MVQKHIHAFLDVCIRTHNNFILLCYMNILFVSIKKYGGDAVYIRRNLQPKMELANDLTKKNVN